jgi:hypothetical protein
VKHVKIFLKIGLILALCLLCVPASAAIARGSAEFTDYQTQYITGVNGYLSIPKPTAVVAGNFMIAQISYDNGTGETITPPPGWTLVRRTDHDTPYGPYGQAIYYKVATSSEGSFSPYGWTFRPWTLDAYGGITRYTGVHPIFPIVTSSGATGWVQQTPPASKLNMIGSGVTAEANSRLVGLYGLQQNRAFGNPPGMTGIYAKAKAFTGSNNGLAIHTFDQAIPTAGATGDKVAVASSIYTYDAYIAQLVDLRDATTAVHGISFATSGLPPSTDVSVTYSGTDPSGNALNGPIIVSSNRPSSTIFTQPNTQFTFSFPTIAGYGVPSTSTASPYTTGSDGATTTITATYPVACTPPSISTQPTAHAACVGSSTSFSVVATGTGPLSYQWYHGETAVGTNSNSLTIPTVAAGDAGDYHVVVTNGCGSATSNPATLTVNTPPSISTQPTAHAACVGSSTSFSVVATGTGPLSYQWYHGETAVGPNSNSLTINPVGLSDAGSYTVVVSSSTGCTAETSNPATLTVNTPPSISTQPTAHAACVGSPTSFSVVATGTGPLSYQWYHGETAVGPNSNSLTIPTVAAGDAGDYHVVVTNGCGSATSNPATLTVNTPPSISTQSTAQAACVGCSATFSVVATGSGTLSYQWYHGSTAVGTNSNTLTIDPVATTDAGNYHVVVSSSTGCTAATSSPATLTVNTPPVITVQPVSVTKYFGDPVTFSFTATGTTPFSYQWKKDGVDITGAHSASYIINHVTFDDAGSYTVIVTNGCGSATSNPAILTVKPAPTTSTVTVSRSPQQYSDLVTLTVTISPSSILGQVPATGANIYVGTQLMGTVDLTEETPGSGILTGSLADVALLEPVPYGTAPTGQMAPGSHTVTAEFTDTNPRYFVVTNPTTPLTITKENAIVTYTGPLFVGSSSTGAATITMTATVQDDADGSRGDIRNAVVKFYNGVTFIGQAPVGLVNPSDTTTGTAVYQWSVNIGNSDSETYVVSASANNYYTGSDTTDITVSKALADNFITGGGYIVLSNSAGSTPGTRGTKNNFGFSVKYNKKLTNLQGHSNVIVRDRGHVYQVKSNAISSLTVNTVTGAAVLTSKATLQDVTDSLNPVPIAGNYVLVLSMTDRGEPGSTDSIAISILDKSGGTWFSSNWNGVKTIEQTLDGGNLVVH